MNIKSYITPKAYFFLKAALLWLGLMGVLDYLDFGVWKNFKWHDLLVEANGMFFDLVIFGVFLTIYEALSEKKDRIERLQEEIDDYRGWDEKEAMYRIVGAVRRLKREGNVEINLTRCYLAGAVLPKSVPSNWVY